MTLTEQIFNDEIESIGKAISQAEKLDSINLKLQGLNWGFLHPYSQGADIALLDSFLQEEDAGERIIHFFAFKFLDLKTTISIIDGFYKKRPFLKDYVDSIEDSVVMCLQKDFRGAINTLLPVIEGALRKYLVNKKGDDQKATVRILDILKSIDSLSEDYWVLQEKYINQKFSSDIPSLNALQEAQLKEKHLLYFELWMRQLKRYLQNNLYLNTNKNEVKDTFNRHIIFHALDYNIDFSFANYLRLFNCISFLSWSIGLVHEECSALSTPDENVVKNKWADYLKILVVSEALTESKSNISGRQLESFKKYLPKHYLEIIKRPEWQVRDVLTNFYFLKSIDRPRVNSVYKAYNLLLFLKRGFK